MRIGDQASPRKREVVVQELELELELDLLEVNRYRECGAETVLMVGNPWIWRRNEKS